MAKKNIFECEMTDHLEEKLHPYFSSDRFHPQELSEEELQFAHEYICARMLVRRLNKCPISYSADVLSALDREIARRKQT